VGRERCRRSCRALALAAAGLAGCAAPIAQGPAPGARRRRPPPWEPRGPRPPRRGRGAAAPGTLRTADFVAVSVRPGDTLESLRRLAGRPRAGLGDRGIQRPSRRPPREELAIR